VNRPTVATYQGGTTSTISTYDAGDRLTQIVDSVSGTITRTYDNLDRVPSTCPVRDFRSTRHGFLSRSSRFIRSDTTIFDPAHDFFCALTTYSPLIIPFDLAEDVPSRTIHLRDRYCDGPVSDLPWPRREYVNPGPNFRWCPSL
jgi:hypothetical protein